MTTRTPDVCPNGHRGRFRVVESRKEPERAPWYRRQRRACVVCAERWTAYVYESLRRPGRAISNNGRDVPRGNTIHSV